MRYIVLRKLTGDDFHIYDLKQGLSTSVAQSQDGTLAHDICLMFNNQESFWSWNTSNPINKRLHAGMGALVL